MSSGWSNENEMGTPTLESPRDMLAGLDVSVSETHSRVYAVHDTQQGGRSEPECLRTGPECPSPS